MIIRVLINLTRVLLFTAVIPVYGQALVNGDDGYRLWLKYNSVDDVKRSGEYSARSQTWYVGGNSATANVIKEELSRAFRGMLAESGQQVRAEEAKLIIGTPDSTLLLQSPELKSRLTQVGQEGYVIYHAIDRDQLFVAANTDIGALYGTYHLLRLMQNLQSLLALDIQSSPKVDVRVLNHWDNLDRHVERGYAGQSIWDWHKLPDYRYQRYYDYARANASVGINGTVLNNVNADPLILTESYLEKVTALADVFRPYGIKVYLSVNFSSPHVIGNLAHSDPLDPAVKDWWRDKVAEIYQRIPDFGGFLVKANSEGQPGPGDYGRTHAEGANMLADALAPHGGIVMWRAFVYAHEKEEERSKQAYSEFTPLDGKFRDNVLIQVKNGPIDFQPREPFSPLFGAMPKTPVMMEFQITMEYLGFSTHWVYLGSLYQEVLEADTYAKGVGSTVAKVVDGSLFNQGVSGMAGVANIGSDRNWTGHVMLQANWYVFGRLSWDHTQSIADIADDWISMTLSRHPGARETIKSVMLNSHQTLVNYMTPLGLHHIMGVGHHYGPGPWVDSLPRDDWNSVYYHRADEKGIGFDRSETGVNAIEQYHNPLRDQLNDIKTTPENLLLWFHHVPWDYQISSSGRTLWDELVHRYYSGVNEVAHMQAQWRSLKDHIDPLIFQQVNMALTIQLKEAQWWRDACVLYFQTFSKRPIPQGLELPSVKLEDLKQQAFPYAPGQGG